MPIYLGPTEHIDHPENLPGSALEQRTRIIFSIETDTQQGCHNDFLAVRPSFSARRPIPPMLRS